MFPIRSSASFDREEGPVSPTLEAASIFRKASKAIRYVLALAQTVISSGTIFGVCRTLITCSCVRNMWLLFGNATNFTHEVEAFVNGHLWPQISCPHGGGVLSFKGESKRLFLCVVCVQPSPPLSPILFCLEGVGVHRLFCLSTGSDLMFAYGSVLLNWRRVCQRWFDCITIGSWKSDANIHTIPRIPAVTFFTKLLILLNTRRSVLLVLVHFNTITALKQVSINLFSDD